MDVKKYNYCGMIVFGTCSGDAYHVKCPWALDPMIEEENNLANYIRWNFGAIWPIILCKVYKIVYLLETSYGKRWSSIKKII